MRRNPERAREAMRRWRQRHPSKHAAEVRLFYSRHRDALRMAFAAYRKANPDVYRAALHRRRARLAGAAGSYAVAEWLALVAAFEGRCAYCGRSMPLTVDHRVPIARGGTNDIGNILPACGPCNLRKHTLTEAEFRVRLARGREPAAPGLRRPDDAEQG